MSGLNNPITGMDEEQQQQDGPARKRRAVEVDGEDVAPDDAAGEQNEGDRPLNVKAQWNTGKFVYKHHRILSTKGYQFVNITASSVDYSGAITSFLTTPLARVPCHGIPFYMSRSEFNELPPGSQIKRCFVEIQPLGYRIPFTTNSASISAVNAATIVLGASAHGLANKYGGNNYTYSSTADAPMIPTEVAFDDNEGCNETDYWGENITSTTGALDYTSIPGCFGREIPLRDYYTSDYLQITNTETPPTIMDGVTFFKMTPFNAESKTITWEYRPQVSVLKPVSTRQGRYAWLLDSTTGAYTSRTCAIMGWKNRAPYYTGFNQGKADGKAYYNPNNIVEVNHQEFPDSSSYDFYTNVIEHSGVTSRGYSEYGGGYLPPSLHIGCLPCNTYINTVDQSSVANIVCLWSCRTMVEVEYSTQYTSSFNQLQPWNAQVLSNWSQLRLGYGKLNVRGMRGLIYGSNLEKKGKDKAATTTTKKP